MTKKKAFAPEPTTGTNYASYYWPKSKVPEKQRIYDKLFELGWRFDAHYCLWFTPEAWPLQGHGQLEHAADYSWARIQPPNDDGKSVRKVPILELTFEEM